MAGASVAAACLAFMVTSSNAATVPDEGCGRRDAYDTPARIQSPSDGKKGIYVGQCVNTKKFRSGIILSEAADRVVFANYLHENEFYKATINLNPEAIERVILQVAPFPILPGVIAGHIQMRFVFKPGFELELESQTQPGTFLKHNDLLVSYEAAFPEGESYNFALGLVDAYPLVARLLSTRQKTIDSPNREFDQYELSLTPEEQTQLMKYHIHRSQKIGMSLFYNTIHPNCTSEIFDGIDALPRFAGKVAPFRTSLSGNPVVGPAIDAMIARGIIRKRSQGYLQELSGVRTQLEVPKPQASALPFMPQITGYPLNLVMISPDEAELTPKQHAAIQDLQNDIRKALPGVLNELVAAGLGALDPEKAAKLLGAAMKQTIQRLRVRIARVNDDLPPTTQILQFHIAPYPGSQATILDDVGVQASIPMGTERVTESQSLRTYDYLRRGQQLADQFNVEGVPFYLKGFVLRVNAQKDRVFAEMQISLGLKPLEKAVDILNSEVHLTRVSIPNSKTFGRRPMALLTYHQDLTSDVVNDSVHVDFGLEGGYSGAISPTAIGRMQVFETGRSCSKNNDYVPALFGRLGSHPLGDGFWQSHVNSWIRGMPVEFRVIGMTVDADDLRIKDIQLGIRSALTKCVEVPSVNEKFRDQGNEKLEAIKKDLREQLKGFDSLLFHR
jgi:hypothetical protein